LEKTPGLPSVEEQGMNVGIMIGSTFAALLGIVLAWGMYLHPRRQTETRPADQSLLYQLSYNKFYIDELYNALIVVPLTWLADAIGQFAWQLIHSGVVQCVAACPGIVAGWFRPIQNGLVQFYALAMMFGLVVFLIALARAL